MMQILGYLMLLLPFLVILVVGKRLLESWGAILTAYLACAAVVGWITAAIVFIKAH